MPIIVVNVCVIIVRVRMWFTGNCRNCGEHDHNEMNAGGHKGHNHHELIWVVSMLEVM